MEKNSVHEIFYFYPSMITQDFLTESDEHFEFSELAFCCLYCSFKERKHIDRNEGLFHMAQHKYILNFRPTPQRHKHVISCLFDSPNFLANVFFSGSNPSSNPSSNPPTPFNHPHPCSHQRCLVCDYDYDCVEVSKKSDYRHGPQFYPILIVLCHLECFLKS